MSADGWHRQDLAPLNIPARIVADDAALLAAACAPYAEWAATHPSGGTAIEIRLELGDAVSGPATLIRVDGSLLTLSGPSIRGWADARTGRASCTVHRRLSCDPAALAVEVIDPILLFLLARMGRPPLHAAGILLGSTVLVLAGPSGSGKSTLALAAAGQGLPVLSDDMLHVQIEPALRVWGFAHPVHVFAEEAPPGDHAIRVRNGKRKAAVPLPARVRDRRYADRAMLVTLARGSALTLEPVSREEGMAALSRLDTGFDLLPRESARIAGLLLADRAWRLTLTDDSAAAITLLRETLGPLVR